MAATAVAAAAFFLRERDDDKVDPLEGKLFAAMGDQCSGIVSGRVQGAELDFRLLSHERREGVGELAVEQEGEIGVELFLELKGAAEAIRPRLRGIDREHNDIAIGVVGEGVEHAGFFEAVRILRAVYL